MVFIARTKRTIYIIFVNVSKLPNVNNSRKITETLCLSLPTNCYSEWAQLTQHLVCFVAVTGFFVKT